MGRKPIQDSDHIQKDAGGCDRINISNQYT